MSDKRSSMREGPLSELFRPTTDTPAPAAPAEETPAWGREAPATFGTERSNYLAVIKCVGVGGAGVNAIDRMIEAGIRGVEFIAVNTDRQSLDATEADVRIPVGIESTRGRGTGGNAAMAEQAMRESEEQLRRALRGADLVFIAAGEGGGTGTGGAPIIAKLAREMGALTIAVVTRPFAFEGNRRLQMAEAGINALRDQADTIIVIQNDRLLSVLDKNVSMVNAFRVCDDLLRQGVQGITDLITLPGLINLDFADVRTVIRGAGSALLGIGYASGPQRAEEAALAAISSPLLETPIDGARGILLGITGGSDLSLSEISRAAKVVSDAADPEANIIFGATVDPELEGKVWVTVVAAGFTGRRAAPSRSAADLVRPAFGTRPESSQSAPPTPTPAAAPPPAPTPIGNAPSASTPIFPPLSPAPSLPSRYVPRRVGRDCSTRTIRRRSHRSLRPRPRTRPPPTERPRRLRLRRRAPVTAPRLTRHLARRPHPRRPRRLPRRLRPHPTHLQSRHRSRPPRRRYRCSRRFPWSRSSRSPHRRRSHRRPPTSLPSTRPGVRPPSKRRLLAMTCRQE